MADEVKILSLELVENGSHVSAIDNSGVIFGTASGSRNLLREIGFAAQKKGYEVVSIGHQSWQVDRLVQLD